MNTKYLILGVRIISFGFAGILFASGFRTDALWLMCSLCASNAFAEYIWPLHGVSDEH